MKKRRNPARDHGSKKKKPVEQGTILKTGKGLIKTALVYPNTYKAGMSSLGFQTVYKVANQSERVSCERVFLDGSKRNSQPPESIESGLRLDQFDIILFSISFENDFIHLVQLLGEAGIPLRSPDRNHTHPLVVAGGVACFLNPEPIAPFIDCFLLGEAECLLEPFFTVYSRNEHRDVILQTLEQTVPGAYVPGRHTGQTPFQIKVQYLEDLNPVTTTSCILTAETAFKDTFLIETLKGCPHGCRFCSAGFIYRPPRVYPADNIYAAIDAAAGKTDKIGLVSSAVADHPNITEICSYGLDHKFKLSFSSLRADKLTDDLIFALSQSKVKTATLAPEAGSERMRNIINKKISEADILLATRKLVENGIINLKLYFMVGLPFERDQDVAAIVALTRKIKSVFLETSKKKQKIGTITLSINPFIPKPCTPFQWCGMAAPSELKQKVNMIRQGLKKIANVKLNIESLKKAKIHALLSRGDRETANIIELAVKKGWAAAIRQHKTYCHAIIYEEVPLDAMLPWDFLDNRVKKRFLAQEYERAQLEKRSPSCPMIDCDLCKTCI